MAAMAQQAVVNRPASAVAPASRTPRFGRWFSLALVLVMVAIIAFKHGFRFFAPWLFRPPDFSSQIIHIHVAIVASWILLLVAQIVLVRAGRIALHKRLGTAGMGLAVLMYIFGILATADQLRREPASLNFAIVPFLQITLFTFFVGMAYLFRTDRESHRRLMLLAMVDPLFGVLAPYTHRAFGAADRWANLSWGFLLLLVIYDLATRRRPHPVTVWGSLLLMLVQDVRPFLGFTHAWVAIATWMRSWNL